MATAYDPAATLAVAHAAENALAQRVLQLPLTYDGLTGVPFVPPILPLDRLVSSSHARPTTTRTSDLIALDHELQMLFAVLLQRLVLPWLRPLTPERGLCQEAHQLVAHLATRVAVRFPPLLQGQGESWDQLHTLLARELPSLLQTHWATYRALPPADRARLGHLDLLTHPHPGVRLSEGQESTLNPLYVRTLIERLLHSLLEEDKVNSDIALYLLRDILSSALLLGLRGAQPQFWSGTLHSILDALQSLLKGFILVYRPSKARGWSAPGAFAFVTSIIGGIALAGQLALWIILCPIFLPSRWESSHSVPGSFPTSKSRSVTAPPQAPQTPPSAPPALSEPGSALVAYVTAGDDLLDLRRTVLGSLISLLVRVVMAFSASDIEKWIISQLSRVLTLPQVTSLLRSIRTGALPMDLDDLPSGFPDPVRPPEVLAEAARRRSWSTLPQHAADTLFSLIIFGVCIGHKYTPFHVLPSKLWVAAEAYTATGGKAYSYPIYKIEGNPKYIIPMASEGPDWNPPPWLARFHQAVMTGARHALAPLCAPDAAPLDTRLALSLMERLAAVLDPALLEPLTEGNKSEDVKRPSSAEQPSPPAGTVTFHKKNSKSRGPSTPSSSPHLPVLQLQGRRVTPPISSFATRKASTGTQVETSSTPEPAVTYPRPVASAKEGIDFNASYTLSPKTIFATPFNDLEKGQHSEADERRRPHAHRVPHLTRTYSGVLGREGIPESSPHSPAHSGTSNGTFGERAFRPGHFATQSLTALASPPIVASTAATANLSSTSLSSSARRDLQRHRSGSPAPRSSTPPRHLRSKVVRSVSPPAGLFPSSGAHKKYRSTSSTFSLGFL